MFRAISYGDNHAKRHNVFFIETNPFGIFLNNAKKNGKLEGWFFQV